MKPSVLSIVTGVFVVSALAALAFQGYKAVERWDRRSEQRCQQRCRERAIEPDIRNVARVFREEGRYTVLIQDPGDPVLKFRGLYSRKISVAVDAVVGQPIWVEMVPDAKDPCSWASALIHIHSADEIR